MLSDDLVERLIQATGMRNVLVHEYQEVDDALVLDALDRPADFRTFAREIRDNAPPSDRPGSPGQDGAD